MSDFELNPKLEKGLHFVTRLFVIAFPLLFIFMGVAILFLKVRLYEVVPDLNSLNKGAGVVSWVYYDKYSAIFKIKEERDAYLVSSTLADPKIIGEKLREHHEGEVYFLYSDVRVKSTVGHRDYDYFRNVYGVSVGKDILIGYDSAVSSQLKISKYYDYVGVFFLIVWVDIFCCNI